MSTIVWGLLGEGFELEESPASVWVCRDSLALLSVAAAFIYGLKLGLRNGEITQGLGPWVPMAQDLKDEGHGWVGLGSCMRSVRYLQKVIYSLKVFVQPRTFWRICLCYFS